MKPTKPVLFWLMKDKYSIREIIATKMFSRFTVYRYFEKVSSSEFQRQYKEAKRRIKESKINAK